MFRTSTILFSLIVFSTQFIQAQVNPIKGSWLRVKTENIDSTKHFNPFDAQNKYYGRIDFLKNQQLRFVNSPYDTGKPSPYKLGADQIEFNSTRYSISHRSDSLLVLDEKSTAIATNVPKKRFHYYEETYLLEKYKEELEDLDVSIQDTLRLKPIIIKLSGFGTTFGHHPQPHLNSVKNYLPIARFEHESDNFETFFQKSMRPKIFNKEGENFTVQITVSEKGKISYIDVLNSDNEDMAKELVKLFKKSSPFWKKRYINGSSKWIKIVFPIIIDKTVINKEKANELLAKGNEWYNNKNYENAIEAYTKALEFDNGLSLAVHNRSMAYFNIQDLDKACQGWYTIYQSGDMGTYEYLKNFCNMK